MVYIVGPLPPLAIWQQVTLLIEVRKRGVRSYLELILLYGNEPSTFSRLARN